MPAPPTTYWVYVIELDADVLGEKDGRDLGKGARYVGTPHDPTARLKKHQAAFPPAAAVFKRMKDPAGCASEWTCRCSPGRTRPGKKHVGTTGELIRRQPPAPRPRPRPHHHRPGLTMTKQGGPVCLGTTGS